MRTMQRIVFLLCILVMNGVYLQAGGDIRLKGSYVGRVEDDGTIRIRGTAVGRFEKDGGIRIRGTLVGKIESDGTIRKRGSSIARVDSDGDVRLNGTLVGKVESDGDVRKRGTLIGSAAPPTCLASPTWPQEQADKQDSVSPQPLFSPDLALLQPKTRQEHEQSDLGGPCFAHYQSRGRELVFLGTQHGTRLDSPSHQLIEQVIDRFRPDCIVIEGSETRMGWSHFGLLQDAKRMVKRGACPEPL